MHRYLLPAAVIALSACTASREVPPRSDVVKWTARSAGVQPAADGGSVLEVQLEASVEPGWKVYALSQKGGGPVPMSVRADSAAGYQVGEIRGPAVNRDLDPNFGIETETYGGTPVFAVAVRIPASVDPSKPIELKVRSQACSDKLCLPARTVTVPVTPAGKT